MSSEYLMRFLEIGAIDLKGDDTKLEKLRATAKDLSMVLKKAPAKTVCFTMAAADPGIASDDPTIQESMTALRNQWETVSNAYARPPVVSCPTVPAAFRCGFSLRFFTQSRPHCSFLEQCRSPG